MQKLSLFANVNNGVNTPSRNLCTGLEWQCNKCKMKEPTL